MILQQPFLEVSTHCTNLSLCYEGLYPKDLQIEELSTHELAVKWNPPEFFEHFELNYLVNVYEIDQNRISVKRHEILSLEPSCLLRDLNSKTIYKISVWPVLAKTQKKKGWPNHTKYMIHDIGKVSIYIVPDILFTRTSDIKEKFFSLFSNYIHAYVKRLLLDVKVMSDL